MVDFNAENRFEWLLDFGYDLEYFNNPPDIPYRGAIVKPQKLDLVSQPEIAERLNVTTNTVHVWRQRHKDFPQPEWVLGQAPVWRWEVIEKWAKETGRLKDS